MNKERICEQLESMEDAFDTLKDNVHWIKKELEDTSLENHKSEDTNKL